jgi:thiol:disulfide interchange protein DsbC
MRKALLTLIAYPALAWSNAPAGCPSAQEASYIVSQVTKTPLVVELVKELPQFNACMVKTDSGESFFISKDRKWVIEGILVKVPQAKLSEEDYKKLLKKALFTVGSGKEPLIVLTNPLCKACKENRERLRELLTKFKLYFVPVGFEGKEFDSAVLAYCKKVNFKEFFKVKEPLEPGCDLGKLKVWSIADLLKKYRVTATPVFIPPSRELLVGVQELSRFVRESF